MNDTEKVAGTYESRRPNDIWSIILLENWALETYLNGEKHGEYKWKIIEEEIHVEAKGSRGRVYRINSDVHCTYV